MPDLAGQLVHSFPLPPPTAPRPQLSMAVILLPGPGALSATSVAYRHGQLGDE